MKTLLALLVATVLLGVAASAPGRAGRGAHGAGDASLGPRELVRGCRGKPAPPVGEVKISVTARPAADRAVLEARWVAAHAGREAEVRLVLPAGAWLVAGSPERQAVVAGSVGGGRWEVGFETGAPLDAVLRLSAVLGVDACSTETPVRLAEAP